MWQKKDFPPFEKTSYLKWVREKVFSENVILVPGKKQVAIFYVSKRKWLNSQVVFQLHESMVDFYV